MAGEIVYRDLLYGFVAQRLSRVVPKYEEQERIKKYCIDFLDEENKIATSYLITYMKHFLSSLTGVKTKKAYKNMKEKIVFKKLVKLANYTDLGDPDQVKAAIIVWWCTTELEEYLDATK